MKKLLILFILFTFKAHAQLSDTTKIQYRLAISGNIMKGNIERVLLNNEASFAYVNPKWGLSSRNTYFYFENAQRQYDGDFASKNFVYLNPKNKFYPYVMAWYESNFRRKIDRRYQIGAGGSYVLIQKPASRMKVSLTLTNEETTFIGSTFEGNTDPNNRKLNLYRYTVRLIGTHTLPSKMRISYEFWGQNAFRSNADPRFYGEFNVDFPIVKKLNFRTTALYAFENKVYEKIKQEDFSLLFGLTYSYK
jgi:Protein of unknown function, DUF481